jgi:hypothetical protein
VGVLQKTVEIFNKYYVSDPVYSDGGDDESEWPIVAAPPLNRLYAIYGTNLDTERIYFYRRKDKEKEAQWWVLDENPQYDAKDPKLACLKIAGVRDPPRKLVNCVSCVVWRVCRGKVTLAHSEGSQGVGFETAETLQPCIEKLTGRKGYASGASTPFGCLQWTCNR